MREGGIPQKTAKEGTDRVGKPRAWGDRKRGDITINKAELKWNPFEGRYVKKEVPAGQPYKESSQGHTEESSMTGCPLEILLH